MSGIVGTPVSDRSMPTAEQQLLLSVARHSAGSPQQETIRQLARQITDWDSLLRHAAEHGIAALVCQALNDIPASELPAACVARIESDQQRVTRRGLEMTDELLRIVDIIDRLGVQVVPFKGPLLSCGLYGSVALRDWSDLDLLVHRQDLQLVKTELVKHGYRSDLPSDVRQQGPYLGVRHELRFTPQHESFSIEVHRAFVPPYQSVPFEYESIWRRVRPTTIDGRNVLTLDAGDLLLVLCVHASRQSWSRLGFLCDLARLLIVHRRQLQWALIMGRAQTFGVTRMLGLGLLLVRNLLGTDLPEEISSRVALDRTAARLADTVAGSLFEKRDRGVLAEHLFFLTARERVSDRIAYCGRLAFTPTEEDYAALRLPVPLTPLYYPLHAARVFGKYGLASIKAAL
jgi:Uncharacterised nucleotidyltransferase